MSGDIVPFGKYKDKPVELMAADRQYIEWLIQQPWFKERYGNIYNVVINYQAEPTETPEHNKIQMLFLDDVFVLKFLDHIGARRAIKPKVDFERRLIESENRNRQQSRTPPIDVIIDHPEGGAWGPTAAIEIKPTIGDNYPEVLRQMKESGATDLLIGEYTGKGATVPQLRAFFRTARIRVTFLSEIE